MLQSRIVSVLTLAAAIGAPAWCAGAAKARVGAAETPQGNYNIPLWADGKVPFAKGDGPLDKPFLTVFLPPESKRNGASIVVGPGGGNIMLMYGVEGMDIAERYNEWGVTAFVLTYRLSPRYNDEARVADGKRAIQMVRSRAAEFKLDPTKVGYIGFSAGSSLGRQILGASGPGDPNASDPVERFSSRPDYAGLVYGPGRPWPTEDMKNFPPVFLCVAQNDKFNSLSSAQLFVDLTKAGIVSELHIYQKGRHGFGSGLGSPEFEQWMPALKHFLEIGGLLKGGAR